MLWTLDLDGDGELSEVSVARAEVRSVAQHTYADVPAPLAELLAEVGERRLALEIARGGVRLEVPEQEVVEEHGSWTVRYRAPLATEDHNAQISLLTGMAAARLMLEAGTGILRTQPPPDEKAFARLRRSARALGAPWPEGMSYPEFVRSLDPAEPRHAALLHDAAGVGHGAGYVAFDGLPPTNARHFAIAGHYAHATAPLRRLQDRYVSECCLAASAGARIPAGCGAASTRCPTRWPPRAAVPASVERGVVDLVEAALLAGREGELFPAVVIDEKLVQLRRAGRPRAPGGGREREVGSDVTVRLLRADMEKRSVAFAVASSTA